MTIAAIGLYAATRDTATERRDVDG